MRIPRIFVASPIAVDTTLALPEAQSHYLSKVLRMGVGRELVLFNGSGHEYRAEIINVEKRHVEIVVQMEVYADRESPLHTHLAIGISRGERMDWVLQKATELGVSKITPLFTSRTEVRLHGDRHEKKMEHWRQIIISACEQCQRNVLPELADAVELPTFLQNDDQGLKLVLHHRSERTLKELPPPEFLTILVGPEGGLSEAEIALAMQHHQYLPLTLGPRVMRTETAPVAALTAVQLLWGDLG